MKKFSAILISITAFGLLTTPSFAVIENITIGNTPPKGIVATTSLGTILSNVITIMFIIGGLGLVIYFLWGALDWIFAGGDKEKIGNARKKIIQGLVGITLLALSFFIIALFGQIVGFNPLQTIPLPKLDDIPSTNIAPIAPK